MPETQGARAPRQRDSAERSLLVNTTRDQILATTMEQATNPWTRARGLMGRRALPAGHALSLRPCGSVHTWGMRFTVDVIHLSRDGVVLRIVEDLRPWRFGPFVRGARWTIELPAGTIRETGTHVGDQIVALSPAVTDRGAPSASR